MTHDSFPRLISLTLSWYFSAAASLAAALAATSFSLAATAASLAAATAVGLAGVGLGGTTRVAVAGPSGAWGFTGSVTTRKVFLTNFDMVFSCSIFRKSKA